MIGWRGPPRVNSNKVLVIHGGKETVWLPHANEAGRPDE